MKYWCIFIICIISLKQAKSQVIYHDLNPDVALPAGPPPPDFQYNLDINADGISDFQMSQVTAPAPYTDFYITMSPLNSNSRIMMHANTIDSLNFGDSISVNSPLVYSSGSIMSMVTVPPYTTSGCWVTIENHFVGVSFNTPSGTKYGWIRLLNKTTIADYAYNDTPGQPILAGEGLPNYVQFSKLSDNSNLNDGRDLRIKFFKVFEESKTAGYKVIVVPSARISTFAIDSAKRVLNSNSLLIPSMNKNIDTVFSSTSTDVYGNLITSLVPYKTFVLTLPDLVTTFDTLMSAVSNEIVLRNLNLPAQIVNITSTKVPGGDYTLKLVFNPPASEAGILNYRLFFIKESDSTAFNIDTVNMVPSLSYVTVPKTGTSQNLNFQSSSVSTHLGGVLKPFVKYKAVLMSLTDGVTTNSSALSNVSNSFTVYTQVQPVNEIIVTDEADNHDISDIKLFFKKVPNESEISGYRGLIIPETSLGSFNLDSANVSTNYIGFTKNGQDQSLQLPSSLKDVHGNMIQESQTYYVKVLTITDNHFSDANALSPGSKYFGFNTPDYFYAGCRDITKAVYHDIQDTGIYSYHLSGSGPVVSYTLDIDANGTADLKFECDDSGGLGSWTEYANVIPLNGTELNFKTLSSDFLIRNDSADMIYDDMNWKGSTGRLRLDNMHPSGNPSPNNFTYTIQGEWEYAMPKFIAVRLIGADTIYAWVRISLQRHPLYTSRSIGIMIYDYAYQKNSEQIGIKEAKEATDISLYPNPAADHALIQCEDFKSGLYKTELLNMAGQIVFSDKIVDDHYKLNTSQLAKGIYAVRVIKDNRNVKIMKLIVQ
jgi:hypothetical protein